MKLPSSVWRRILQLWHLLFPIHLKPERYIISIFIKIIISWTVEVLKNSMSYVYSNLETDLAAAKKPRHSIASQAVILRLRRRFPVKQKSNKKIPDFDYVKKKKKILIDYDLTRWRKQILQFSHFSYIQPIRLKLQCTIAVSYSNIEKKEKDCYNFIFFNKLRTFFGNIQFRKTNFI